MGMALHDVAQPGHIVGLVGLAGADHLPREDGRDHGRSLGRIDLAAQEMQHARLAGARAVHLAEHSQEVGLQLLQARGALGRGLVGQGQQPLRDEQPHAGAGCWARRAR